MARFQSGLVRNDQCWQVVREPGEIDHHDREVLQNHPVLCLEVRICPQGEAIEICGVYDRSLNQSAAKSNS